MKNVAVILKAVFVVVLLSLFINPQRALAGEPTDGIRSAIDGVIRVLKDPAFKGEANTKVRREKIRRSIQSIFSFEDMSRRSLGKHWRKLTASERAEFVAVFGAMVENSYIGKLEKYTDERVLYEKETVRKRSAEVRTKVITSTGTKIPINYRLSNKSGQWLVYDVIVEGVSLVRNYRSQFATVLKKEPIDNLIATLKSKAENSM